MEVNEIVTNLGLTFQQKVWPQEMSVQYFNPHSFHKKQRLISPSHNKQLWVEEVFWHKWSLVTTKTPKQTVQVLIWKLFVMTYLSLLKFVFDQTLWQISLVQYSNLHNNDSQKNLWLQEEFWYKSTLVTLQRNFLNVSTRTLWIMTLQHAHKLTISMFA